jgi:hypothetical protein
MTEEKECFFITPIGDEGSEDRIRSDKVREYILEEALSEYDYSVTRADDMDNQGSITNKVLLKTIESDLVIADLTNRNANAFYELGVRHATGKPYIQMMDSEQSLPIDLQDERTVFYGLDVAEADKAREKVKQRIEKIEQGNWDSDNPVSRTINFEELVNDADPDDRRTIEMLQNINDKVNRLDHKVDIMEKESKKSSNNTKSENSVKSVNVKPEIEPEKMEEIEEAFKDIDWDSVNISK